MSETDYDKMGPVLRAELRRRMFEHELYRVQFVAPPPEPLPDAIRWSQPDSNEGAIL